VAQKKAGLSVGFVVGCGVLLLLLLLLLLLETLPRL
jgi:hypothetical protein